MKDRKSIPKTALPRIYFIDREIASGKYPNTRTLAKVYETSIPTISRDIEFMRNMLSAPIEYDYTHKGYYYTEKTFRLLSMTLPNNLWRALPRPWRTPKIPTGTKTESLCRLFRPFFFPLKSGRRLPKGLGKTGSLNSSTAVHGKRLSNTQGKALPSPL